MLPGDYFTSKLLQALFNCLFADISETAFGLFSSACELQIVLGYSMLFRVMPTTVTGNIADLRNCPALTLETT